MLFIFFLYTSYKICIDVTCFRNKSMFELLCIFLYKCLYQNQLKLYLITNTSISVIQKAEIKAFQLDINDKRILALCQTFHVTSSHKRRPILNHFTTKTEIVVSEENLLLVKYHKRVRYIISEYNKIYL